MSAPFVIYDEMAFYEQTGKLFPLSIRCTCSTGPNIEGPDRECPQHGELSGEDRHGKPLDFDSALPMYRVTIKSRINPPPGGSVTQFEVALDAAELDFLKRLSATCNEVDRVSTARPRIYIHRRIHEGDIKDDANFVAGV